MSLNSVSITVFIHLYYENGFNVISDRLNNLSSYNVNLLVNISADNAKKTELAYTINEQYPNSIIISSPNTGKDIGGKLALMDLYLATNQQSEYILLLHDKDSPQVLYNEKWRDNLMKIAEKENINKILTLFEHNPAVGIICSSNHISNEYDKLKNEFKTTNNQILKNYINKFQFNIKDYSFVAGNMFWVRSCIYKDFFEKHNPLELRSELEKENVLDNEKGTKTHSLERVFSWLATNQGYTISGI